jgi:hypothetical protein
MMADEEVELPRGARVKRVPARAFETLQMELDLRLTRGAQIVWMRYFHAHYQDVKIPIPSHFYWKDAAKLFLHWLLFYGSLRQYKRFGVPKSSMDRLIDYCMNVMADFAAIYVVPGSLEERKQLSANIFDPHFKFVTFIIDGTHTPCAVYTERGENAQDYYSFKIKGSGLNTQVAILADGKVAWTSSTSAPCSTDPDIKMMQMEWGNFTAICEELPRSYMSDWTLADGAYFQFRRDRWLTPHRKPPRGQLTPLQERHNKLMQGERGKVERNFAELKNIWSILRRCYTQPKRQFNGFFRLCCAMHNLNLDARDDPRQSNEYYVFDSMFAWEQDEPDLSPITYVVHPEEDDRGDWVDGWDFVVDEELLQQELALEESQTNEDLFGEEDENEDVPLQLNRRQSHSRDDVLEDPEINSSQSVSGSTSISARPQRERRVPSRFNE